MTPRYAILGPPRSGTGYASTLLTAAGLDCGHEAFWRLGPPLRTPTGDSSWLALPALELARDGIVVFALLRDPRDVVASIAFGELWTHPARRYLRFAIHHAAAAPAGTSAENRIGWSTRFATRWLERTLAIADVVLDLDVLHPDQIAGPVGLDPAPVAQYPPTDTNTRGDHPSLTWDDLGPAADRLRTIWDHR